jgi:hypothetical protein
LIALLLSNPADAESAAVGVKTAVLFTAADSVSTGDALRPPETFTDVESSNSWVTGASDVDVNAPESATH